MGLIELLHQIAPQLVERGHRQEQIPLQLQIQVAELLFSGVLEEMDMHQLAATFTALIHEDRRRADPQGHRQPPGPDACRR